MAWTRGLGLALFLGVLIAAPSSAQSVTIDLIDTPDVLVANEPGTTYENPSYPFTVTVRVTNDDQRRNVSMQAITYIDTDVDDCPQEGTDHPPPPVFLIQKQLEMAPSETRTIGGSTDASTAQENPDEYWPMAVSKTYRDRQGNNVSYSEGEHSFCIVAVDVDRAEQCASLRECTLDRAAFSAYVRRDNQPPAITEVSVQPDNPRPGQSTVLSAEAIDNSTTPRQDSLTYTWIVRDERKSGATVQHAFDTQGFQEVRLEVSDGFDTVNRTIEIPVGNVSRADDGTSNPSPAIGGGALLAGLAALAWARRRRT